MDSGTDHAQPGDTLKAYRARRSPDTSPEPVGTVSAAAGRLSVVHKHAARQLHFDLRLEMETDSIRWIPTDDELRLDVAALRSVLSLDRAAGDVPMMIVATAGSVSTGAVDPIREIAALCRDGLRAAEFARIPRAESLACSSPGWPARL